MKTSTGIIAVIIGGLAFWQWSRSKKTAFSQLDMPVRVLTPSTGPQPIDMPDMPWMGIEDTVTPIAMPVEVDPAITIIEPSTFSSDDTIQQIVNSGEFKLLDAYMDGYTVKFKYASGLPVPRTGESYVAAISISIPTLQDVGVDESRWTESQGQDVTLNSYNGVFDSSFTPNIAAVNRIIGYGIIASPFRPTEISVTIYRITRTGAWASPHVAYDKIAIR